MSRLPESSSLWPWEQSCEQLHRHSLSLISTTRHIHKISSQIFRHFPKYSTFTTTRESMELTTQEIQNMSKADAMKDKVEDVNASCEIVKNKTEYNNRNIGTKHKYEDISAGGDLEDKHRAETSALKAGIEYTFEDTLEWASAQFRLGCIYHNYFFRSNTVLDLQLAIKHMVLAVNHMQTSSSDLCEWQNKLAEVCQLQYKNTFNVEHLEEALKYQKEAVINVPPGHSELPGYQNNLGCIYQLKYEGFGRLDDLEEAQKYHYEALINAQDMEFSRTQYNLGRVHQMKYERYMNMEDLDAALKYQSNVLMSIPAGHPRLCQIQGILGMSYNLRYNRYGNLEDLEIALKYNKEGIMNAPPESPEIPALQMNLGVIYHLRYQRHENMEDLETALKYYKETARNLPDGHSALATAYNNLGTAYQSKYKKCGDLDDLEVGLTFMKKALVADSLQYSQSPDILNNLAVAHQLRYASQGALEDLNAALKYGEDFITKFPIGHPVLPKQQSIMGNTYYWRYEKLGDIKDLDLALNQFQASAEAMNASASLLLMHSIRWAEVAHSHHRLETAMSAYTNAFKFLPQAVWLGIHFKDRQYALKQTRSLAVNAAACCIQNNELKEAIEFLEHGRFVLLSQLLQLRNSYDELQVTAPDLCSQLYEVSKALELSSNITRTSVESVNAMNDNDKKNPESVGLGQKWDALVSAVRKLPGFSKFLKPPSFEELSSMTISGPVVILNCSQFRCDALIIEPNSINVHIVPLEKMSLKRAVEMRWHLAVMGVNFRSHSSEGVVHVDGKMWEEEPQFIKLEDLLDDLYYRVVSPVISCIQALEVTSNHIWWCPTGAFTSLPFHAALIHGASTSGNTISYISSYTPILGTLRSKQSKPTKDLTVVAVAVPHTKGETSLPETLKELEYIAEVIEPNYQTSLIDDQVSCKSIIDHLPLCDWAHFSCHGVQDFEEPLRSGLVMPDGQRLELSEILKLNLPKARFIFLSACQTGLGDIELLDEALHMAGGFIFAGFQGAIATLWSMDDADGAMIAKDVYTFLTDNGKAKAPDASRAAEALHHAVAKLHKQGVPAERWAPYIHMGI